MSDKFTSFVRGFGFGQRIAEGHDQAQQKRKLREIAEAEPTESSGYTEADGQQLEALANAKDEQGRPYYTVSPGDGGGYQVTPNFEVDGQAATPVPVSMRKMMDFLGRRTDGAMDDGQLHKARTMEMARVLSPSDPVAALQLQNIVMQGERDNQRFKTETVNAERSGRMADLQLRAAEEGEKAKTAQRDFTVAFANTGWSGLPALYERYSDGNTIQVQEDGKGGATLTQIGADGKVLGQQTYSNRLAFYQDAMARFDPTKWADVQEKREATQRTQANEDRKHNLDSRRLDITENYYTGMLDLNGRKVESKNATLDDKMSEADKVQFGAIGAELKTINDSLIKAQADGLLDPTNPSAGVKALMDRKAALSIQQRQIIGRYQAAEPQADPLGLRKPAQTKSGGSSAPAASPAGESPRRLTREQQSALDKDIPIILAREREAVLQRVAAGDERAKTDLASIEREIARLPKGSVPASRTPTMAASAGEPAPKPPPAMATMTGTAGDRQLKEVAIKNGYKPVTGQDGKTYFSRVVNGQGENLTEAQLAKRLNVGM